MVRHRKLLIQVEISKRIVAKELVQVISRRDFYYQIEIIPEEFSVVLKCVSMACHILCKELHTLSVHR